MYNNLTVLVIDDSNVERHLLKEMLTELKFASIIEATNGEDGVKMAEEHKPNLILMDVVMPGINGFQATKKIVSNEELKNIPVIMCTSKNQETDKTWGARQGAKAYVTKPVDKNILFEEIRKLLN
ncbi:MAG: response regulator [Campylobacterales bacterium]|nr:response regulator [Campylobacterales bacterium]